MGSCSSGGPNKLSAMCLAKQTETDYHSSRMSTEEYLEPISGNQSRGHAGNSSKLLAVSSREPESTKNYRKGSLGKVDENPNSIPKSDCTTRMDHSYCPNENGKTAINENSGARENSSTASPCSSSCTAIYQTKSQKRTHEYQRRKASALSELYQWSSEYGSCIVAPPNRTVLDALSSPCGRLDYSIDSGWYPEPTMAVGKKIGVSCDLGGFQLDDHRSRTVSAVENSSRRRNSGGGGGTTGGGSRRSYSVSGYDSSRSKFGNINSAHGKILNRLMDYAQLNSDDTSPSTTSTDAGSS